MSDSETYLTLARAARENANDSAYLDVTHAATIIRRVAEEVAREKVWAAYKIVAGPTWEPGDEPKYYEVQPALDELCNYGGYEWEYDTYRTRAEAEAALDRIVAAVVGSEPP